MGGGREQVFRVSPQYELIPFDRLQAGERAMLGEWAHAADGFGIVRPRAGNTGTVKTVSRDAALLLYTLHTPGPIAAVAVARGDQAVLDAAWRFVLDGILEVELDGAFVSGAHAVELAAPLSRPAGAVAGLSHDAIVHAARNTSGDALTLSRRLYQFGRQPLTPHWSAAIPTSSAVLRYAGVIDDSKLSSVIAQHWESGGAVEAGAWLSWWPHPNHQSTSSLKSRVNYKLYVAPTLEALPSVFPRIIDALVDSGCPPFKMGASAQHLLRPDKIVCYFATRDDAQRAATLLAAAIGDTTTAPVPFTQELAPGGIVSLGADPPSGRPMAAQLGVSWRQWVCRRLAAYLDDARKTHAPDEATQFALRRIAMDGIDRERWEPSGAALETFVAEPAA